MPTSLDRRVTQPYREDTSPFAASRCASSAKASRRAASRLKRAPELRGLLSGFTALLTGDAAALERNFSVAANGSDDAWTLELTPTDTRARRRLQQIEVNGRADVPRCFSMLTADGGASVLLLGAAARARAAQADDPRDRSSTCAALHEAHSGSAGCSWRCGSRHSRCSAGSCSGSSSSAPICACSCPIPTTPEQRLLLDEIGEGPASRVLVDRAGRRAAPSSSPTCRARSSRLCSRAASFRLVTNGEVSLDAVPDELLPYRYLLSPTLDTQPLDAQYLHGELLARARDLASPAGAFLEPWLPRDPTLELLKLLQRWQPMQEPHRQFDVWFDRAGQRALLLADTQAPAFDPDRQRLAIGELEQALTQVASDAPSDHDRQRRRQILGADGGAHARGGTGARHGSDRRHDPAAADRVSQRIGSIVLSALPLASAALAGLAAVSALFGTVHGITLAFGFTLIGVAQDYPMHLLSHRRPDREPVAIARGLWPTLATGVASTCIAYLTFLFSGVIGLAQLACFTVAGSRCRRR